MFSKNETQLSAKLGNNTATGGRIGQLLIAFSLANLLSLGALSPLALATESWSVSISSNSLVERCEHYLAPVGSTAYFLKLAESRLSLEESRQPLPEFVDLQSENQIKRYGTKGPNLLQALAPDGMLYVATRTPTTEHPAVINTFDPKGSIPFFLPQKWRGKDTSTIVYASLPKGLPARQSRYLIGPEYDKTIFFLHGGGTPTASGKNMIDMGSFMQKQGIPVVGFDLMGHGLGTRVPMKDLEEMAEYVLETIKQTVAPGVEVALSGHSWGGMFALYMQRMALDPKWANDPNFQRIKKFISLAPGIDVTEGGDEALALAFEREFQKNLDRLEQLMAPGDFEFLKNIVANGKLNPLASLYLIGFEFGYKLSPLSKEQLETLPPILVIVGEHDGITYVNRERFFSNIFGAFERLGLDRKKYQYVVLPPGETFKSAKGENKKIPTGHNLFDRYFDGTETPETYGRMAQFVNDIPGEIHELPGLLKAAEKAYKNEQSANRGSEAEVARTLRTLTEVYANNAAFREFLSSYVYFVKATNSEVAKEMAERKKILDAYVKDMGKVAEERAKINDENKIKKEAARATNEAFPSYAFSNYHSKLADWELSLPPSTAERTSELKKYIEDVDRAETEFKKNFTDPKYAKARADLLAEVNSTFAGLHLEGPDFEKLLSSLRLEELGEDILGPANITADVAKSALLRLKTIDPKTLQIKSSLVSRLTSFLGRYAQEAQKIYREHDVRYNQELDKVVESVPKPAGVANKKFAQLELSADRSEARKHLVQNWKDTYEKNLKVVTERAQSLAEGLKLPPLPPGISSLAEAEAEIQAITQLSSDQYVPKAHPELAPLVETISNYTKSYEALYLKDNPISIGGMLKQLHELEEKRHRLVLALEEMWSRAGPSIPAYYRATSLEARALADYTEAHDRLQLAQQEVMLASRNDQAKLDELWEKGDPRLTELSQLFAQKRKEYLLARENAEKVRLDESIAGRLRDKNTGEILPTQAVVQELWGNIRKYGRPTNESLEVRIDNVSHEIDLLRSQQLEISRQLGAARMKYWEKMAQIMGDKVPTVINKVEVAKLFERVPPNASFAEIATLFEDESNGNLKAIKALLDDWRERWNEVVVREGFKNLRWDYSKSEVK